MFQPTFYYSVIVTMLFLAIIVFVVLHRITAGYGMMYNSKWGLSINNRLGWILMEAPSFVTMLLLWILSERASATVPAIMAILFEVHYFQRTFIFPLLIRGKSRMPLAIMIMGMIFNVVNAYMIGGWLFYVSPPDYYNINWLYSPTFIIGTIIFFAGMWINLRSDSIVRHLRKPGDNRHYIPRGGMYRYVTSANYFGEITEWVGYAILTWSLGGLTFAIWTFANLAPRARSIHYRYINEFGKEYKDLNRRYIIPFIY
ncbi:MAG: DUF1295 domain-containing protein [Bacteroidales bacterium]|nr:DUF1295 domain-containing protein [Bacteroidales bacterium]MBD5205162.1 DUF1295 domain-containing protein [Bacteroidales bacterium]MBD5302847.1 DUF1295 domain-containing protein [Bacteroides sp.]MBD5348094.1 DUF1295 domain-containing protein [Bacteroides sp.]